MALHRVLLRVPSGAPPSSLGRVRHRHLRAGPLGSCHKVSCWHCCVPRSEDATAPARPRITLAPARLSASTFRSPRCGSPRHRIRPLRRTTFPAPPRRSAPSTGYSRCACTSRRRDPSLISVVRAPRRAAWVAAVWPAAPPPISTTSASPSAPRWVPADRSCREQQPGTPPDHDPVSAGRGIAPRNGASCRTPCPRVRRHHLSRDDQPLSA